MKKKLKLPNELAYLLSIVIISFSVAMTAAADFGVSMIVAPAYIFSLRFPALTFGQWEYVVQGVLFIVFCIIMKRVRLVYFGAFVTCLLYGAALDFWRMAIPLFNPNVTAPGSMAMPVRIALFIVGMVLTSFSVALCFCAYLYPQVYDFFVKGVTARYRLDRTKFKRIYDAVCLAVSVALSLLFFHRFRGIGAGTVVLTLLNGILIGWFGKLFERYFAFPPLLPRLAARFESGMESDKTEEIHN